MKPLSARLGAMLLAAGLLASACQSSTVVGAGSDVADTAAPTAANTAPESVKPTATAAVPDPDVPADEDQTADDDMTEDDVADAVAVPDELRATIENIANGYRSVAEAWEGFVPNAHPVVLALNDADGRLTGALAINHPRPEQIGDAITIETGDTPFTSLHLVTRPTGGAVLQAVETFEFALEVGGVSSFVMIAGGPDEFFDPTSKDYVSTMLHEMFHRYQAEQFTDRGVDQDIDGYDYSPSNLALIGLEDRALAAAISADEVEARNVAARHLVAIRHSRLEADSRVALDNHQETREGTARYIEHVLAGSDTGYNYHLGNVDEFLITDLPSSDIKGNMAFGRWYASGAAMLHLLKQLAVAVVPTRVVLGESPFDILDAELNVDPGDYDWLVDEAKAAYDPDNELEEQAAEAAETVLTEPSFWGDDAVGRGDVQDGEQVVLTQVEVDCLIGRGVVFTDQSLEISDKDWAVCFDQG